jgi:hypothetical protein
LLGNEPRLGKISYLNFCFLTICTHKASDNKFIYFKFDPIFSASVGSKSVEVKVTYLDNGANWNLEYRPNGSSKDLISPTVTGAKSGLWKTVTFIFVNLPISSGLPDNMDFRLHAESGDDLTVRFVRIIKP